MRIQYILGSLLVFVSGCDRQAAPTIARHVSAGPVNYFELKTAQGNANMLSVDAGAAKLLYVLSEKNIPQALLIAFQDSTGTNRKVVLQYGQTATQLALLDKAFVGQIRDAVNALKDWKESFSILTLSDSSNYTVIALSQESDGPPLVTSAEKDRIILEKKVSGCVCATCDTVQHKCLNALCSFIDCVAEQTSR